MFGERGWTLKQAATQHFSRRLAGAAARCPPTKQKDGRRLRRGTGIQARAARGRCPRVGFTLLYFTLFIAIQAVTAPVGRTTAQEPSVDLCRPFACCSHLRLLRPFSLTCRRRQPKALCGTAPRRWSHPAYAYVAVVVTVLRAMLNPRGRASPTWNG